MKQAKYYSIFDEDIVMVNTKGASKLAREYFAMLGNADTQAWYDQRKQIVKEDFALNIFTRYSANALQIWALQRFTEDNETKFLTHIFELQDFFDLPDQDLSEALRGLQKDLTLANTEGWQDIFCTAIEALGDKYASEWMAKIDAAEKTTLASE
jgi:hypothetical protein